MTAALQQPVLKVEYRPIDGLKPSPLNPRRTFTGIDELAESIKKRGIEVPLRVRPIAATDKVPAYEEIVFGERRWRAAKKAGLEQLPVIVKAMSDGEALELMLVELAQTSDVHPVEEAEAYLALHRKHKLSVEEIAAKVGKSKSHVYGRMKLAELAEPVRKEALQGELPAPHALLIARVPSKLQPEALKAVGPRYPGDTYRTYREAFDIIQRSFMLSLAEAQFDKADEKLVAAAGSCSKCPKRTGNQPDLFGDVKSKDVCTDPICFEAKNQAHVKLTIQKAKESGKKVLGAEEAKNYFGHQHGRDNATLIDLDEPDYRDPRNRTWREKLGKKVPDAVIAVDDRAKVHELVPRKEIEKALPKREAPKREVSMDTQQKHKMELRRTVVAAAVPVLFEAMRKKPDEALRFMVDQGLADADVGTIRRIAPALGVADVKDAQIVENGVRAAVKAKDYAPMIVALATLDNAEGWTFGPGYGEDFAAVCKLFKVDLKKLEGVERARKKAEKKKPAKSGAVCPIPGCGETGTANGGWCAHHDANLTAPEKKSILERNKRLAAEGKLPAAPKKKKAKKK